MNRYTSKPLPNHGFRPTPLHCDVLVVNKLADTLFQLHVSATCFWVLTILTIYIFENCVPESFLTSLFLIRGLTAIQIHPGSDTLRVSTHMQCIYSSNISLLLSDAVAPGSKYVLC
jgi:hypothetical protein